MSTSLAQQLKRLAAPQTTLLQHRKTQASLLFDPKEAANKDRETIYEIGLNGLEELISLNQHFSKFENSLFDKSSKNLQRAVETKEVNEKLNKTIKSFLLQLSPYFLLQQSHKCLEWLIRRFQIHEYNKDEFMMLVLPYHETTVFVRCVQIMNLKDENDKWHWLQPISKSGIPLPKQTLFNHAGSNPAFLKFIGKCVLDSIVALDVRAHTIQTVYAFYCTTLIGTISSLPKVQETHISSVLPALLKGLSSDLIDFVAASYMITGLLVSKVKFNTKLIDALLVKICNCPYNILQTDSVMLMVLIFTHQQEEITEISDEALAKLLENKWFSSVLGQVAQNNNITPLYVQIMSSCLKKIQLKHKNWVACKKLMENFLIDIVLKEQDAEIVVQCALDSYALREKPEVLNNSNSVITIVSDDENEQDNNISYIDDNNLDVSKWYSEYLKKLERQYSDEFEKVIKSIMKGDNGIISKGKRTALKAALSFLLKANYNEDDTNVFENLYHHSATQRIMAVKHLSENFNQLQLTSESKELFRDSILERLNDSNPSVVEEVLKIKTQKLLTLLDKNELIDKLLLIIPKSLKDLSNCGKQLKLAVKLMVSSSVLDHSNYTKVFIGIFPLLFPVNDVDVSIFHLILNSNIVKFSKLLMKLDTALNDVQDHSVITQKVHEILEQSGASSLPFFNDTTLDILENMLKIDSNCVNIFYNLLLLSYSLPKNCDAALSHKFLRIGFKYFNSSKILINSKAVTLSHKYIRRNILTIHIYVLCINSVLKQTNFSKLPEIFDFSKADHNLNLILFIFETVLTKFCTSKSSIEKKAFSPVLLNLLNTICHKPDNIANFLSNFVAAHTLVDGPIAISLELQLYSIKILTSIIEKPNAFNEMNINSVVHILSGLNNKYATIREGTIILIETIQKTKLKNNIFEEILQRKHEIIMDDQQISLIIYMILSPPIRTPTKASKNNFILKDFIQLAIDDKTSEYLVACVLELLKHLINTNIVMELTTIGNRIYDENTTLENSTFSYYQSEILKYLFLLFNRETIQSIEESESAKNFIFTTFKKHDTLIRYENKLISPATFLLDVIEDESYQVLSDEYKILLVNAIVETSTYSEINDVTLSAQRLMKKIDIDAKIIEDMLIEMKKLSQTVIKYPANKRRSRRSSVNLAPSVEILQAREWKKGVSLLEFLQNKNKLFNVEILIPHFFDLLKECLSFEEQSPMEYVKQMLLSCILHCAQKLSPDGSSKRNVISDNVFRIELVVQCIRASQNPQTHHHALLLLCHSASMIPEQVLHNMMNIFTFMGSSIVRHDDAYSFQIISKIIDTVIPILVQSNDDLSNTARANITVPVLKIFSDIILDIPEHRRVPLYVKLITTLGPKKFLWMFFGTLFESHVSVREKEKKNNSLSSMSKRDNNLEDEIPRRLAIALTIAHEFELETILETCIKFLEYISTLPIDRPETISKMDIDITDESIFLVEAHSAKQLRHFKYIILQFIGKLTSSPQFINRIATLSEEENKNLKPFYQSLLLQILGFIPIVTKATEKFSDSPQHKYWKIILHNCYDILDNTILVLSTNMFLIVTHGLLQHKFINIRKRVIELLINKIQHSSDFVEKSDVKYLLQLLAPLCLIIDDIGKTENIEMHVIEKAALIAVKHLSKELCKDYPKQFTEILDKLIEIAINADKIPKFLLATVTLCLGEICVNLRAHALSSLSKFMPILLNQLKSHINAPPTDLVLINTIISLHKIIESIPLFLSPYIVKIITILAQIASALIDDEKMQSRLSVTFLKLSSIVPGRILIPSLDKSYQNLLKSKKYTSIPFVMIVISDSFRHMSSEDLNALQSDLTNFFMRALQFRSDCDDEKNVNIIESEVVKAFVGLILKLSESTFRPLYYKIYDWAIRTVDTENKERSITFYALSYHVAEALKSIFTLFANSFIQNSADLLNLCNTFKIEEHENELYFSDSKTNNITLIENIIKTLYLVFLHDSQNFMNVHHFNILMQSIVDQVENELVLNNENLEKQISLCIAQLAISTNDDCLWKQLNYQVLLKTRTNNPAVRLFALNTFVEIAKKLGDEFVTYLPEAIPFLAELLEDENPKVEKSCQKAIQELEKLVGESLQKYF